MKISIETDIPISNSREDMVGNVYPVRGGFGARNGHMHVIISAVEKVRGCCQYGGYTTLTVDADGDIVGANQYAFHYFESKTPIARVDGLEDFQLVMRSL